MNMKTHLLIVSVVAVRLFERSEDGHVVCYDLRDGGRFVGSGTGNDPDQAVSRIGDRVESGWFGTVVGVGGW